MGYNRFYNPMTLKAARIFHHAHPKVIIEL